MPENTLPATPITTDQALALFDGLPTVDTDFMLGAWQGSGLATGHRLDGVLEACHWHGKHFRGRDDVDPLVFRRRGGALARLNPALMPMTLLNRLPAPNHPLLGRLFQGLMPALQTGRGRARLRMIEHRGKLTAAMLYDDLPINDVFRKLDDNRVVGLMDMKGMTQPFFFVLQREPA